ncbi:putative ATPase [Leptomonas seymouri]|uniref:Putative ATPase n=1 Tax=Leptomonas seymouri TaxID=5684 RepID=A0A0N1IKU2_LEPSE|nr:putative ATPase [Leptomonas seymouri]|eukprot:KPI87182.1 putative ATPase [Leptomonas seymouri]
MVSTRAQARRGGGSDSDNSGDVDDNSGGEAELTPRRQLSSRKGETAAATTAAVVCSSSPVTEGERLGRGCRVSRSSVSLDEQYLAASLYRSSTQQRGFAVAGRHSHDKSRAAAQEEAFTINRRYPMREAAKRAMKSLHVTLTSANGAAGLDDEDEEERSNSMGAFHFRNHPELTEEIQRRREKQRRRLQRGRDQRRGRKRRSSDNSSSDEDTAESGGSSSSDSDADTDSGTSSSGTSGEERKVDQLSADRCRGMTAPTNAAPHQGNSLSSSPRASGGGVGDYVRPATTSTRRITTATHNSSHNDDAVSLDSSITEASMREESVERMAMQDRHARSSSSSSSENGGDGTRDFATDAERRRAMRNARESVDKDVKLNYYMHDAVGAEDVKKIRRRQLDRRYRWLVYQAEEARARGDACGIGSGGAGDNSGSAVTTANGALGDILPLRVDDNVTFDSVGGLPEHIVTLREMVLLPLLYPDLFERLDLKAPRGVLFVGPPGTGKTLMARALANEGTRLGCGGGASLRSSTPPRITFFVRKGADMLSKWVGESERQLKLLFEEAKRLQPSIIFFDEVDGLAPTRHAKTEQTQAALVSTLLALLDGLEDRGQVVVIGATNRPDTLDPALRRPGRFDRELVFPLPDAAARRHILSIQLAKKAMPESAEQRAALLSDLVEMTEGYSGADLGALCTEASLHRLRTALPQLYLSSARLIVPREVEQRRLHVRTEDFYAAAQLMQPSLHRSHSARHSDSCFLDAYVEVLVRGTRDATLAALAPSWSLVDRVLCASSRDCQNVSTAVRALSAVPIPQPPRPCLLVLHEAQPLPSGSPNSSQQQRHTVEDDGVHQQQQRALQLHHLSISLLKGLTGLHQIIVNLPELVWEGDAAASAWPSHGLSAHADTNADYGGVPDDYLRSAGAGGGDSFTHMGQVVLSVRRCSPCVVYLSGAEEWLSDLHCFDDDNGDNEDRDGDDDSKEDLTDTLQIEGSVELSSTIAAAAAKRAKLVSRRQQRRVQIFRYYMAMLANTDVIFLIPCATAATRELLLGKSPEHHHSVSRDKVFPDTSSFIGQSVASSDLYSITSPSPSSPMLTADPPTAVHLTRMSARHQMLHPQFSIVCAGIAATPLPADLRRFVEYLHRIVTMTLTLYHGERSEDGKEHCDAPTATSNANIDRQGDLVLREDHAPLPSPLAHAQLRARDRANRARRCEVWRKVEYRRLQLRHVLMKWVTQYINSGKFKLLASENLDLAPDDPLYKAWRRHTRHHRVGLQDILEKVEDQQYVCLSQYHDDIDQLVRNVRSFFRTRAAQDQRYRLKALDLKETCLLNMYKMNREVIRFCEQTRDLQEPSSSDSEEDDSGATGMRQANGGKPHMHRRLEKGGAGEDASRADLVTSLVRKEKDPALIAEQARRAVSFPQRSAAPLRKRRRSGLMYSERRRRRKRAPAVQKQQPAAEQVGGGGGENEDTVNAEELSNAGSNTTDDTKRDSGAEQGDEENEERKSGARDEGGDEGAELSEVAAVADECVEAWSCALLSNFTYTRLYHVFKSVMRGLELEVRRLNAKAMDQRQQQQPAPASSTSAAEVVSAAGEVERMIATGSTSAPSTRESRVTSVFKALLLAAVQE